MKPAFHNRTKPPAKREREAHQTRPSLRIGPGTYIAHTQPGFEPVAWSEVEHRIKGARQIALRTTPDRAGMAIFSAPRPDALASIRTAEDLFAVIAYRRGIGPQKEALAKVRAAARSAEFVEDALAARVSIVPGSRTGGRLRFKVVARMAGEHEFRRVDLKRVLQTGITERGDRGWRLDEDNPEVEFWATLLDDELILAVRLSDDRLRHREYKIEHRPGSLRPSVAAALAWLSEPAADDVFLDPMCGVGTVLIERAQLGRYAMLLGGDSAPQMLEAARENIGPRYKPIELRRWDAAALPLQPRSVSKIATNLPWGIKHGSHSENRRLYPRILAEFRRVLRDDGRAVILTAETRLMRQLWSDGVIKPAKVFHVSVLGIPAAVYVCPAAAISPPSNHRRVHE